MSIFKQTSETNDSNQNSRITKAKALFAGGLLTGAALLGINHAEAANNSPDSQQGPANQPTETVVDNGAQPIEQGTVLVAKHTPQPVVEKAPEFTPTPVVQQHEDAQPATPQHQAPQHNTQPSAPEVPVDVDDSGMLPSSETTPDSSDPNVPVDVDDSGMLPPANPSNP